MSSCIKDLYDYDLVKTCRVCKNVLLKSNFHKNKNMSDGLHSYCIPCRKEYGKKYYIENFDKIKKYNLENQDRIKRYYSENRNQINAREKIYLNNRYKTDITFRLIKNTRNRIYKSLKGMVKSSSTKDILGIDIDTYRKLLEFKFTPEMNWSNIQVDHVKPICMFDVSKDEELKEAFNWKNTQPLHEQDHQQKWIRFNFLDYQLQFIKSYQFMKLNDQDGLHKNLY